MSEPIRLNLGGDTGPQREGYISVDRKSGGEIFPLRLADGTTFGPHSVDAVLASHCLEHLDHDQANKAVMEWARVLKPGGTLSIAVPDLRKIAEWIVQGQPVNNIGFLYGGQTDADDYHKTGFTLERLFGLLKSAGLTNICRWESTIKDCASLPVSLNLQGTKPQAVALMSAPRIGFLDNCDSLFSLADCRIPMKRLYGAFWQKSLTLGLEACLEQGHEFVIVCDYDSTFEAADALVMLEQMKAHPEAGAIAGVQVQRGRDCSLIGLRDEAGEVRRDVPLSEFTGDLTEVQTSHFGLTVLRLEALASMPKPWLPFQYDADGGFGEGAMDPDIVFWLAMNRAGWKVYQSNRVAIGHMQLMRSFPGKNFAPTHQYPDDYSKVGKPEGVWR